MAERFDTRSTLLGACQRALGNGADVQSYRRLGTAMQHRTFLVRSRGLELVAKLPDRSVDLCLDPELQCRILERVAALGLGPEVLGFDAETGVLLSEYRGAATSWTAEQAGTHSNIVRIAESLRGLHTLNPGLRAFEPRAFATCCMGAIGWPAGRDTAAMTQELDELHASWRIDTMGPVLCHNDLVGSNVLDDGRLWLIDFEYGVSAPPIVDLASLSAMNRFTRQQQVLLLDAYYGAGSVPYEREAFAKVVRIHELIAHFWRISRQIPNHV